MIFSLLLQNAGEFAGKNLRRTMPGGWNFRGEYIKEVKIQKISGDASY